MLALQSMFWTANNSSFFYVESCVLSPFWTTSYVIWASKSGAVVCSDPSGPFLGFRKRTQFLPIHTHSERHTDTLLSLLYTERSILPPVVIAYYPLLHYPFFFFFFFLILLVPAWIILRIPNANSAGPEMKGMASTNFLAIAPLRARAQGRHCTHWVPQWIISESTCLP